MSRQDKITRQKLEEFKEIFRFFDKDNDNLVNTSELPRLVKALNQTPTQSQLAKWSKIVDRDAKGKFQCEDFVHLMAKYISEYESEQDLIDAMQSIFEPTGSDIIAKQFRNVVTTFGQKVSEEQLNQIFKVLKMQKDQAFNYKLFIKNILKKS